MKPPAIPERMEDTPAAATNPALPEMVTLIAVSALAYVLAVALHEHAGIRGCAGCWAVTRWRWARSIRTAMMRS
jgi:hypothetical protein